MVAETNGGDRAARDSVPAVTGKRPGDRDDCCKVTRVARAYNLDGLDSELRRRRTETGATLHELADYLNERLTAAALRAAGVSIDAEPGTVYAALRGRESVPLARRDEIREAVVGNLDLDRLERDYTSHETVRKHLNDHLDVSTAQESFETRAELAETLVRHQDQYESAVVGALDRAGKKGLLAAGDYNVFTTRVECRDCGTTYRLQELIESGGCACAGRASEDGN